MTVGQFSKEEAQRARECVIEMHNALSKRKQAEYIGELNEAICFIEAAGRVAPAEEK